MSSRSIAAIVALLVIGSAVVYVHSRESAYVSITTQEQREADVRLASQLRSALNGSFVVYKSGSIALVQNIDDRRQYTVYLLFGPAGTRSERQVTLESRELNRIVLPQDSEWPRLARLFLVGNVEDPAQR